MTFSRRPESPDNQERREAFREQAATPNVTVLGEAFATLVNDGLNSLRLESQGFLGLGVVGATVPGLRSQFVHLPSGQSPSIPVRDNSTGPLTRPHRSEGPYLCSGAQMIQ